MTIIETVLLGLSLSADTLSVSMAGSVSLGKITPSKVAPVAFAFGFMQAGLMFVGWLLGASIASFIEKMTAIIGFLLLLYIGGTMIVGTLRKKDGCESREVNLSGIKSLLLSAVATSIDATAVGVSMAMAAMSLWDILVSVAIVFVITAAVATCGVIGGCALGRKVGKSASIIGGIVLIVIGISFLIS